MLRYIKNLYLDSKILLRRNDLLPRTITRTDKCSCPDEVANPDVDDTIYGDALLDMPEEELERLVDVGRQKLSMMEGDFEPNFIVDFHVFYDGSDPRMGAENTKYLAGYVPECLLVSAAHSLHDALRNRSKHYDPLGIDTNINVSMGMFHYIDGTAIWGDNYKNFGITTTTTNIGLGQGVPALDAARYAQDALGTRGNPNRSNVFVSHRINPSNVAGFAYMGQQSYRDLFGSFVARHQIGNVDYLTQEDKTRFGLTFAGQRNKTLCHEFGHQCALFHTFQGQSCEPETNPLAQGDRVSDTPPESRTPGTPCFGINNELHMSYGSHFVRSRFTYGQFHERMKPAITNLMAPMFNNPRVYWHDEEPGSVVLGCTDPNALNYNPLATEDNGTCRYPVLGCTDPRAINYNPSATIDDGSCVLRQRGCTDPEALNYNPDATDDDGSCVYPPPVSTSPEIISITQTELVDEGEEVELTIRLKNADKVIIVANKGLEGDEEEVEIEYNNPPPSDLIASFKGENFLEELGWRESISGKYATGSATEYSDADGVGVLFGKDITEVLEFADLQHGDYTYKIKLKPNVIGSVKSILSKRIHHSNNQSWLFLFTFTGNRVFWDNTTNLNRMDSGIVPVAGEVMEIHVTRDLGMWINGIKVAESGNADRDLINDAILRIGNDHTASNRGLEGIIYSIDIYNKSIAI